MSCTSITGENERTIASKTPGTTTSITPICTSMVVKKIRINNFGNTGALAPMARRALTR
ncbi:hypothetical protein D3C86_2121180 [compost metagenome]